MRTADLQRVLAQRADIVAAAVIALDAGTIGSPGKMSRRRRWQLLGLDAKSDLAAVIAARRGKRTGLVIEVHCFRRHDGTWVWEEMGPSLDYDNPTLPSRAASTPGGYSDASGRSDVRTGDTVWLWHLVAAAVQIRTDGRTRLVPPHGWVVTVHPTPKRVTEVLDANGTVLAHLEVADPRRVPRMLRAAMWWNRRRLPHDDQWFNDAPHDRGA